MSTTTKTNWLRDSKWGIMAHFLDKPASSNVESETSLDDWNRTVDGFDAAGFATDLADSGARYAIFTLGQNTGHFCSPNATYGGLMGQANRCSTRDLVADVASELAKRGLRTIAYLPSHAPACDPDAVRRLACMPPWDPDRWGLKFDSYDKSNWTDERLSEFQGHWQAVIREWSERWKTSVSGWWIDGCYYWDKMYVSDDEPNFYSFAAALRSGNPDSLLAFNSGTKDALKILTPSQDYTPGEVATEFHCGFLYRKLEPSDPSKFLQILSFLGDWWGRGNPRFDDDFPAAYTRLVIKEGGAMTWDVPVERTGRLNAAFMPQLRAIGQAARNT